MKKLPGGGVLLETEEEAEIAQAIVNEQPLMPRDSYFPKNPPSDNKVMERILERMMQQHPT